MKYADCDNILRELVEKYAAVELTALTSTDLNAVLNRLEILIDDSALLTKLEAAGVDNWSGYDEAAGLQDYER